MNHRCLLLISIDINHDVSGFLPYVNYLFHSISRFIEAQRLFQDLLKFRYLFLPCVLNHIFNFVANFIHFRRTGEDVFGEAPGCLSTYSLAPSLGVPRFPMVNV